MTYKSGRCNSITPTAHKIGAMNVSFEYGFSKSRMLRIFLVIE